VIQPAPAEAVEEPDDVGDVYPAVPVDVVGLPGAVRIHREPANGGIAPVPHPLSRSSTLRPDGDRVVPFRAEDIH